MEFRPTYSYRTASYGGDVLSGMSAAISSPPAQSPAFNATIVIRVPESTIR